VGLGGYLGESAAGTLHAGNAGITLRFDLYGPVKEGGGRLLELYEALCGALMVDRNPFCVRKLVCGEIQYDGGVSVNRMTARATLSAALTRSEDEGRFETTHITKRSEEA
jgi:hypothetical protein